MASLSKKRTGSKKRYKECRVCFNYILVGGNSLNLFSVWQKNDKPKVTIAKYFTQVTNVQVSKNDEHSNCICFKCFSLLKICVNFIKKAQKSDMELKKQLHNPEIETPSWPKPIQVEKVCIPGTNMLIEIKQEVLSEDDVPMNECYDDDMMMDIKKEPEDSNSYCTPQIIGTTSLQSMEDICDDSNSNEYESLAEHLKDIKEEPLSDSDAEVSSDLPLNCMLCTKMFHSLRGLKAHVIAQHSYATVRRNNGPTPVHQCRTCKRSFFTHTDLIVHETCHGQFACYMCNAKFETFNQLTKHRKKCRSNAINVSRLKTLDDVKRPSPDRTKADSTDVQVVIRLADEAPPEEKENEQTNSAVNESCKNDKDELIAVAEGEALGEGSKRERKSNLEKFKDTKLKLLKNNRIDNFETDVTSPNYNLDGDDCKVILRNSIDIESDINDTESNFENDELRSNNNESDSENTHADKNDKSDTTRIEPDLKNIEEATKPDSKDNESETNSDETNSKVIKVVTENKPDSKNNSGTMRPEPDSKYIHEGSNNTKSDSKDIKSDIKRIEIESKNTAMGTKNTESDINKQCDTSKSESITSNLDLSSVKRDPDSNKPKLTFLGLQDKADTFITKTVDTDLPFSESSNESENFKLTLDSSFSDTNSSPDSSRVGFNVFFHESVSIKSTEITDSVSKVNVKADGENTKKLTNNIVDTKSSKISDKVDNKETRSKSKKRKLKMISYNDNIDSSGPHPSNATTESNINRSLSTNVKFNTTQIKSDSADMKSDSQTKPVSLKIDCTQNKSNSNDIPNHELNENKNSAETTEIETNKAGSKSDTDEFLDISECANIEHIDLRPELKNTPSDDTAEKMKIQLEIHSVEEQPVDGEETINTEELTTDNALE